MPPIISFTYTTKTKTQNGLKKELIKKYKESFEIPSTTRLYNMDDWIHTIEFDIENPNKGRGYIEFEHNGSEINASFYYSPQYVSR